MGKGGKGSRGVTGKETVTEECEGRERGGRKWKRGGEMEGQEESSGK